MASISLKYKSKQGNLTAPGDVDPGAMIPIATVTVGSGGSSSISFTNIPQNYEHLQLRIMINGTGSASNIGMIYNSDSGSNYAIHRLYGNGSGTVVAGYASQSVNTYSITNTGTTSPTVAIVDILDYSNTNKYKTMRSLSGYDANGSGYAWMESGLWMSTNAITSITFGSITYNQYSSFALYGIKKAGA